MFFKRISLPACLAASVTLVPAVGWAAHIDSYVAVLQQLNSSGVTGRMNFTVDNDARTLTVAGTVTGLEPNQVHIQHIHGRFDGAGNPINSITPDMSDDADGDGFVEVLEGLPDYGDILLPLEDQSTVGDGPFVGGSGVLDYFQVFDLDDDSLFFSPVSMTDYDSEDIFPLDLREYVIHGMTVPGGISDMLPDGGYLATLPVAAAQIQPAPIPLPAGAVLLGSGLAAFGATRMRKRQRT